MDTMWMAKQMIDFQKTAIENTYNAVTMLQDHTEMVSNTLFEQANWVPEEGRRVAGQWTETFKKGRNDLKAAMDDNYDKLSGMLVPKQ